jgi:hypothetical protein
MNALLADAFARYAWTEIRSSIMTIERGRSWPPRRVAAGGMKRSWKSCQASSCSR